MKYRELFFPKFSWGLKSSPNFSKTKFESLLAYCIGAGTLTLPTQLKYIWNLEINVALFIAKILDIFNNIFVILIIIDQDEIIGRSGDPLSSFLSNKEKFLTFVTHARLDQSSGLGTLETFRSIFAYIKFLINPLVYAQKNNLAIYSQLFQLLSYGRN